MGEKLPMRVARKNHPGNDVMNSFEYTYSVMAGIVLLVLLAGPWQTAKAA